jgi:chitin synthase
MAARPPRSVRPRTSSVPRAPPPGAEDMPVLAYPVPSQPANAYAPPQSPPLKSPAGGVQFDPMEGGERRAALDRPPQPGRMPSAFSHGWLDPEGGAGAPVGRKKSLVRPEREKIEPGHRQWHYRTHAVQAENDHGRMGVLPSGLFHPLAY